MKTTCLFFILVAVFAISFTEAFHCPDVGFFANEINCQGYTMCYRNPMGPGLVGVEMHCPRGMAFEREGGYCSSIAIKKFCIPGYNGN